VLDDYQQVIFIPKINVLLPIVQPQNNNLNILRANLDQGAVFYPGSALFGQPGQSILLGHSAPDNWPDIKYDNAFSRLDELTPQDIVTIYYQDKVYIYQVTRSEIIDKGGNLSGVPPAGNSLVLITCWPPGKDQKRIAVEATLLETK